MFSRKYCFDWKSNVMLVMPWKQKHMSVEWCLHAIYSLPVEIHFYCCILATTNREMKITSFWQWKANKLNEPPSISYSIHVPSSPSSHSLTLMTMASNYSPGFMRFYFIMSRYHSLSLSLPVCCYVMRQQRGNFFHFSHTMQFSLTLYFFSYARSTKKTHALSLFRP